MWNFPAQLQPDLEKYPFDPNRRDPITPSVNLNTGQVAGSFSFQAQCQDGVLYGFHTPPGGGHFLFPVMCVLALLPSSDPIIAIKMRTS
jgi:hypothetical protein